MGCTALKWGEEVYTGCGRRVSERRVQREGGKEGRGERERQDVRLISYPCIIQQENGEFGQVVDMDDVEIINPVPLNESLVNERKVLGGAEHCMNEEESTRQDGR